MVERMIAITLKGYTEAGFGVDLVIADVSWDKVALAVSGLVEKAGQVGLKPVISRNNHEATKQALDLAAPVCKIHGEPMTLHTKGSSKWYSHKLEDGSWCRGKEIGE